MQNYGNRPLREFGKNSQKYVRQILHISSQSQQSVRGNMTYILMRPQYTQCIASCVWALAVRKTLISILLRWVAQSTQYLLRRIWTQKMPSFVLWRNDSFHSQFRISAGSERRWIFSTAFLKWFVLSVLLRLFGTSLNTLFCLAIFTDRQGNDASRIILEGNLIRMGTIMTFANTVTDILMNWTDLPYPTATPSVAWYSSLYLPTVWKFRHSKSSCLVH